MALLDEYDTPLHAAHRHGDYVATINRDTCRRWQQSGLGGGH